MLLISFLLKTAFVVSARHRGGHSHHQREGARRQRARRQRARRNCPRSRLLLRDGSRRYRFRTSLHYRFTLSPAFFVVRTKANVLLERRYSRPAGKITGLRSDHTVILTSRRREWNVSLLLCSGAASGDRTR